MHLIPFLGWIIRQNEENESRNLMTNTNRESHASNQRKKRRQTYIVRIDKMYARDICVFLFCKRRTNIIKMTKREREGENWLELRHSYIFRKWLLNFCKLIFSTCKYHANETDKKAHECLRVRASAFVFVWINENKKAIEFVGLSKRVESNVCEKNEQKIWTCESHTHTRGHNRVECLCSFSSISFVSA